MVEKISTTAFREPYQKHKRNISAFSTISDISVVTSSDPLKRDDVSEIKCVLLCDSEHEKNCMLESFNKCLTDGQSSITNLQVYDFSHWEHTKNDNGCVVGGTPVNLAHDCRHCLPSRTGAGSGGITHLALEPPALSGFRTHARNSSGTIMTHFNGHFSNNDSPKYYFRFSIGSTIFRLLLLSKDKQNLLKPMSFDFIFVGAQVDNRRGRLDMNIWEFEWKRLERHSRRAAAPIILMGYFRSILNLHSNMQENFSLEKVLEETRASMRNEGVKHKVIPKFCDLQLGTSEQLVAIFSDVERLYKAPGYLLQQCAYYNNIFHFTKVIESPSLTGEHLCYTEGDKVGDNPIMIAAKLRHKDLVCALLRSNKFQEGCQEENRAVLNDLIHMRNKAGDTLLAMVALQGPELEEQKLLILRKEIQIHIECDLTHEADQIKLQRCLRGQLKSSAEAAVILDNVRALQGIPKTEHELKMETCKVWSRLFFSSLMLSLLFNLVDNGSDTLIMFRYYNDWQETKPNGTTIFGGSRSFCGEVNQTEKMNSVAKLNCANCSCETDIPLDCITENLSDREKFGFTLLFLLLPWPFFIYEFFTSEQWNDLKTTGSEIINEMSECKGLRSLVMCYLRAILYFFIFLFCFILWPVAVLFIKYYNDGKYYLARGPKKAARERKIEASEVLFSTARVMEVSLESSFQPTIQLYLMFPQLMKTFKANTFSLTIATFCTGEAHGMPMLKTDQTISIITSIISLAWCFTYYQATLKRGALDKDLAAIFYRVVLFLACLLQILGRIFIFVLFSYSFGKGMYYPLLIFLGVHIVIMSILHVIFSDAKKYWQKGGVWSFGHYIFGNGLANIYIHNWIRMDPLLISFSKPLQHVSTLCRQLVFDSIFISENIILLAIALNSEIKELKDNKIEIACILMGFSIVGVVLKCVYYRYLHIWAWLIMDYITKIKDDHWSCTLISHMYFMGSLKDRKLTLCCLPSPLFKLTRFLFGERRFEITDSHCSRCSCIFTIILTPIVFSLALAIVFVIIALVLVFLPIYLVLMLPCVLIQLFRKESPGENVVKKFFNVDDVCIQGTGDIRKDVEEGGEGNQLEEGFQLTNDHLKSKLNTRRASSIEDESEMKESSPDSAGTDDISYKGNGVVNSEPNNGLEEEVPLIENEKNSNHQKPHNNSNEDATILSTTKQSPETIAVA